MSRGWAGRGLLLLFSLVVLLAAALVGGSISSYRSQQANAKAAVVARLQERAWTLLSATRGPGRRTSGALAQLLAARPAGPGYVHFMDDQGVVLASTRAGAVGQAMDRPALPETGPEHPVQRWVETTEGPGVEVWAQSRPRGPGARLHAAHAITICVGTPLAGQLSGLEHERVHLAVSVVGAVLLLALAVVSLRAARRAAELGAAMQREQRLASLGELAAIVAHEIRTPVAAARGYAQVLLERLPADEPRGRAPAEQIVVETDRLAALVDDLLGYARPNPPTFTDFDLAALARETAERHVTLAHGREVRLLCEADAPVPVRADRERLRQALGNLMLNAVQLSPASETVVVRACGERRWARVEVADRGPGVPEADRQRIFEPFFTTRAAGTGLGLAVSRRVADEHGGTLDVQPREGGGSVFALRVPRRPLQKGGPA